jgi:cyclopropane-fatty-acyl-phospholipid synthase
LPIDYLIIAVDNEIGVGVRRELPRTGKMTPTREILWRAHHQPTTPPEIPAKFQSLAISWPDEEVCSGGVSKHTNRCVGFSVLHSSKRIVLTFPDRTGKRKGNKMRLVNDQQTVSRLSGERPHIGRQTAALDPLSYEVIYADGRSLVHGNARPAFTFALRDPGQFQWLQHADLYSAAMAFIQGKFDIYGDIIAAIEFKRQTTRLGIRDLLSTLGARFAPQRVEAWFQSRRRAARNIRFHYDRSNDFYRTFLDSKMVYSCAYFKDEANTLDEAQTAKLEHICRKLDLQSGESFLDVGCGWGALAMHASENFGAHSTGCTLSLEQEYFASRAVLEKHLEQRVEIRECDYRQLDGRYSKIASVGMFEHVGRKRLAEYFRKIFDLLDDDGLFLNHGIIRPEGSSDGPETLFLQRKVFPGGELATLAAVLREAGCIGFEVLDVESLRPHYAITCRRWVNRLIANAAECLKHVDRETYRTWLLYLAGSSISFESGATDIYQVLMAKRQPGRRKRLTREYMYA